MDRPTRPVNAPLRHQPSPRPSPRGAALVLAALLLAGCSFFEAPVVQRGNRVTEDQLREITPGVQTRADVQALLGSPTHTSTFSDGSWFYISSKTRQRPGRALAVTDQETVVIDFDPRGVVREIRRVDDGKEVEMVSRETPTPGNDRTLLQALFGNVGRIGPGANTTGGPGAAAPGPGTLR